jgi:fucose 4-O-acetylase-like acetyltransferase
LENIKKTNRILWIDVCRGIGILLVVLGHCDPFFNKYIYGFHMPLFFLLSGWLYNKQKSGGGRKNL